MIDGAPLYRGELTVGSAATDRSSAVLYGAAAVGSVLLTGPARALAPDTATVTDGLVVMPLAGPGTVISATAPTRPRWAAG